jgi:hypothetical protein
MAAQHSTVCCIRRQPFWCAVILSLLPAANCPTRHPCPLQLYAPPGSTCLSVNPADLEKCCADKAAAGTADETCPAPPGSTCASVNPVDFDKCCADKAEEGTADATCPSAPLAPGNYADFPYMAYLESPAAPNGTCGGALVAPGYVLTAAQASERGRRQGGIPLSLSASSMCKSYRSYSSLALRFLSWEVPAQPASFFTLLICLPRAAACSVCSRVARPQMLRMSRCGWTASSTPLRLCW